VKSQSKDSLSSETGMETSDRRYPRCSRFALTGLAVALLAIASGCGDDSSAPAPNGAPSIPGDDATGKIPPAAPPTSPADKTTPAAPDEHRDLETSAGDDPPGEPPAESDAEPAADSPQREAVVALRKLGAEVKLDRFDEIVSIDFRENEEITDADLEHVRGLPRLQTLNLSLTGVTDEGLVNLRGLDRLRTLNLAGSKVTSQGLVHLTDLPELRELRLWGDGIDDAALEHIGAITSLTQLDLSGTQVTGSGFKHLAAIPRLRVLYLHWAPVGDEAMESLKELTRLDQLCLDETLVSDKGLVHVGELYELEMLHIASKAEVTDAGLKHLHGLDRLKELQIRPGQITEAGLSKLKAAIPQVEIKTLQ
jgi:Leucine Rich repeat